MRSIQLIKYLTELECSKSSINEDKFVLDSNDVKFLERFYDVGLETILESKNSEYLKEFVLLQKDGKKDLNGINFYFESRKLEIKKYIRYRIYFFLLSNGIEPKDHIKNAVSEVKVIEGIRNSIKQ